MIRITSSIRSGGSNKTVEVIAIQRSLSAIKSRRSQPFYSGRVDGRYGPKLAGAIASFQQEKNVRSEKAGEISPFGQTIKMINKALTQKISLKKDQIFYTGLEKSVAFTESNVNISKGLFYIRPSNIPRDAVPLLDDGVGAVIGFRSEREHVGSTYDLRGSFIQFDEPSVENPWIDPVDLLTVGGAAVISVRKVLQAAGQVAAKTAGKKTLELISRETVNSLRSVFRSVTASNLKFTVKTTIRMKDPDRYVPVHILKLAIKHGKRSADPHRVPGAFKYAIPMIRNKKDYVLEVVMREKDKTVLHFKYKR